MLDPLWIHESRGEERVVLLARWLSLRGPLFLLDGGRWREKSISKVFLYLRFRVLRLSPLGVRALTSMSGLGVIEGEFVGVARGTFDRVGDIGGVREGEEVAETVVPEQIMLKTGRRDL